MKRRLLRIAAPARLVIASPVPQRTSLAALASLAIACGGASTAAGDSAPASATPMTETPNAAASTAPAADDGQDPLLWLEEVDGDAALTWVRAQNERSLTRIEAHPLFETLHAQALEVLTSEAALPYPSLIGDRVFNFWRDVNHERGIWRATTIEGYRDAEPPWATVLDIDALAASEGENWVWAGASCREPDYQRCIVELSLGGSDATVQREFDLGTNSFVEGGFTVPSSKSALSWRTDDSMFYGPAFADEELTDSGYPRTVRLWDRGTPREEASLLFEGNRSDVSVSGFRAWDGDVPYDMIVQSLTFYTRRYHVLHGETLVELPIPIDARLVAIVAGQVVVELKSAWDTDTFSFPQGALVSFPYGDIDRSDAPLRTTLVFAPSPQQGVEQVVRTGDGLVVSIIDNVVGTLLHLRFAESSWEAEHVALNVRERAAVMHQVDRVWTQTTLSAPGFGAVNLLDADARSGRLYYQYTNFLSPSTVVEADASLDTHTELRAEPAWFATDAMRVAQHFATSADGTQVPYFLVTPADFEPDGTTPTLLSAYGGFEVSRTPVYSGVLGRAWLERGGAYVLANIRGGGEFGPRWHQAALRENRQRAFDDLIAVADDLVARGITAPQHLGIQGGSNGGLLVGAVMVQRPDLFGAVVCAVPLLDMQRYHRLLAGASWMAEYGDPDNADDWAFLSAYSPFQNVSADAQYPTPFFWTSTRDDRVHPGHARRMAARMLSQGHDVLYYENIEGGHGGAANKRQQAYIAALSYAYLWEQLAGE